MKRKLITFAITALFAACNPVEYDMFSTLNGTVIDDSDDGNPLPQVKVTLSPSGRNTYTGTDGLFSFKDIDPNQYTIWVQKTGYSTDNKTVTINPGETTNVTFVMKKKNIT